jgi:hypothetical protein
LASTTPRSHGIEGAAVDHPRFSQPFDHDRQQSTGLRRSLLTELGQPHTKGFGVHFAGVVFGRVDLDRSRPAWRVVDA